ncbi:MAG: VTT domain-containing protein [Ktedonobacteraceae bacterium]|nr:VTT domain-containing protein [Ktedonobacteraceae bacterium]
MSAFLPVLISWMQQSGYVALWLSIFVAAIGIPLPISFMLLAAGAFAALGDFNIFLLGGIALTASVCGDSIGYLIGYLVGVRIFAWFERTHRFKLFSVQTLQNSRRYFSKRGGWAIFLSRFIVSALGGTINLLAGAEIYPYRRFLLFDISGEAAGAIIFLALGYTFGASWEALGNVIGTISLFILALLVALFLTYRLVRLIRRIRSVPEVQEKQGKDSRASVPVMRERPDSLPL